MIQYRFALLAVSLTALGSAACSLSMMNTLTALGRTPADNPALGGQALTYSKANSHVPFEGASACTTWPIEDHATVQLRGDQLCIDALITHLETMSHSDRHEQVSFSSDPAGDLRPASTQSIDGQQRKVGSCYSPSTHQSSDVWNTVYQGCVPNQSATGTPVLTAKSTYFDATGVQGWKFAAAATAPATAPAPASAAPAPQASR